MFLGDVLSKTNILSLLLQSDKKDFSAIVLSVNMVIEILKNTGENIDTNYSKNFNNTNKIIEKIMVYERQNIVSSGTCKHQKQDHNLTKDIFHKKVIKLFIDELIKEMKNEQEHVKLFPDTCNFFCKDAVRFINKTFVSIKLVFQCSN